MIHRKNRHEHQNLGRQTGRGAADRHGCAALQPCSQAGRECTAGSKQPTWMNRMRMEWMRSSKATCSWKPRRFLMMASVSSTSAWPSGVPLGSIGMWVDRACSGPAFARPNTLEPDHSHLQLPIQGGLPCGHPSMRTVRPSYVRQASVLAPSRLIPLFLG